jgi:hypothetical protein
VSKIWDYIEPWIDRRRFAFTTFSLFTGAFLLYSTINKIKVSSTADLRSIDGTLLKYSFVEGKKGTKTYYLWLVEYPATFQISADFSANFQKRQFEALVQSGQKLKLQISKFEDDKLRQVNNPMLVYDIQVGNIKFLRSNFTIKQENSPLFYYVGAGFLVAGLGFFFFRKRQLQLDYR